jgi:hypothetical protein
LLEKNLKHITSEVILEDSPYYGLDGYTEIRGNGQLDEVMGIIEMFSPILGLDISVLDNIGIGVCAKVDRVNSNIFDIDNGSSLIGLESLVSLLLDNLVSVSNFSLGDVYIEVRVDLASEFSLYSDLNNFIDGIDISFRLEYYNRFRLVNMCPEIEVIFNGFGVDELVEVSGVIFRFRRYFRDSALFILGNLGNKDIIDRYNRQMELLLGI